MLEEAVNQYGQEQRIRNSDKIVKIGDRFLQVRLIETNLWNGNGFSEPMPRARFITPKEEDKIHYIVGRDTIIKLKGRRLRRNEKQWTY